MSSDTRTFEIEGRALGYPSFYRDGSSALGLFLVPVRRANALIAQSGFQVAKLLPGRAAFTLTCVHYTDSDCGVYDEISLAFFVQKFASPRRLPYLGTWWDVARSRAPSHTWRLPVTSTLARDAGIRMWGFPKTLEDIRFELSGGRAGWALYDGGRQVLGYSVRARGSRHQPPSPTPVYSLFEGAPHVSQLTQEFRDLGVRLGDGRLSLGEHPVADELRSLGLPRRPLLSAWMGRLAFEISAPEKL
jgi:hypothetical protein